MLERDIINLVNLPIYDRSFLSLKLINIWQFCVEYRALNSKTIKDKRWLMNF